MKQVIVKLKEAAASKTTIAQQEVVLWRSVVDALDILLHCQEKPNEKEPKDTTQSQTVPRDDRHTTRYINTEQAMQYLGVGRTTLYRLRKEGLKCIKIGKATRWQIDDLDAFAARNVWRNN